jgi:hypothetical protein
MTLNVMTLDITALGIMTLSVKKLSTTIKISYDDCHILAHCVECHYTE